MRVTSCMVVRRSRAAAVSLSSRLSLLCHLAVSALSLCRWILAFAVYLPDECIHDSFIGRSAVTHVYTDIS